MVATLAYPMMFPKKSVAETLYCVLNRAACGRLACILIAHLFTGTVIGSADQALTRPLTEYIHVFRLTLNLPYSN